RLARLRLTNPLYYIQAEDGIQDRNVTGVQTCAHPILVIPYITIILPLSIWVLSTFFQKIPSELEESAKLDGASPFQTFRKIILPLAAPGVFTTGILAFIAAWNDYLFVLTINIEVKWLTVSVGIAIYTSEFCSLWVGIYV